MGFGAKNLSSPQRMLQVLSLKKSGLGSPALGGSCANFCSVVDNGVGDYTIQFTKKPFAQIPEVLLSSKTSATVCRVGAVTNLQVQILCFAMDGTTPAEADFDAMIIGSLASDLQG